MFVGSVGPFPYDLDDGADRTYMPRTIVDALRQKGCLLDSVELDVPVLVRLAVDGPELTVSRKLPKVGYALSTKNGNVQVPPEDIFIVEEDMECVLVGRPALCSVGIDVQSMMEQIALDQQAAWINTPGAKLKSIGSAMIHADTFGDQDIPMDDDDIIGATTAAELDAAITGMLDRAVGAGLPAELVGKLSAIVHEHKDVWRVKLLDDPPIKVRPWVSRMKPGSSPYRCATRRYNELSRKFMREFTQQLEAVGFIRSNSGASQCSAAHPVPKSTGFRMTIDFRAVNLLTERANWPMPIFDVIMQQIAGSGFFCTLDLFKGYWQLPCVYCKVRLMGWPHVNLQCRFLAI